MTDISALLESLKDTNPNVHNTAITALAKIGAPIVAPLRDFLHTPEGERSLYRHRVLQAIAQIRDPNAIPALVAVQQDYYHDLRTSAAEALLAIHTPEAIAALIPLLTTAHDDLRHRLAFFFQAQTAKGNHYTDAIPALIQTAYDQQDSCEQYGIPNDAIRVLGTTGDLRALAALFDILYKGSDIDISHALAGFGIQAIPGVLQALQHPNNEVRRDAVVTLGKIDDPTTIPPLLNALQDPECGVRMDAADALANHKAHIAFPALLKMLHDTCENARYHAADALGKLGNPAAVPHLLELRHDSQEYVYISVVRALGNIGDTRATSDLIAALAHSNSHIRQGAWEALVKIKDPNTLLILRQALQNASETTQPYLYAALEKLQ